MTKQQQNAKLVASPQAPFESIKLTPVEVPKLQKRGRRVLDCPPEGIVFDPRPGQPSEQYEPLELLQQHSKVTQIGCSSEGVIDLVRHRATGQLKVFKRSHYAKKHPKHPVDLFQEADKLMMVNAEARHANIISMSFLVQLPDMRQALCLEFCEGGDLHHQLVRFQRLRVKPPVPFALHCMIAVADALAYLHHGLVFVDDDSPKMYAKDQAFSGALVHRDIKPANILLRMPLDEFGMPTPVLADFGQVTDHPTFPCGTKEYWSPEQHSVQPGTLMSSAIDVYTYGLTMYEVCHGFDQRGWHARNDVENLRLPSEHEELGIHHFLRGCLEYNPGARITMDEKDGLASTKLFRYLRKEMIDRKKISQELWNRVEVPDVVEEHGDRAASGPERHRPYELAEEEEEDRALTEAFEKSEDCYDDDYCPAVEYR